MDIAQQNVLDFKSKELILSLFTSVLGIFMGFAFMIYFTLINFDLVFLVLSILSLISGVIMGVYVERRTNKIISKRERS